MSQKESKAKRGFGHPKWQTPEGRARRLEICKKGGAAVPRDKRSFSQDRELAAQAGMKGGQNSAKSKRGPWNV